MDDSSFPMIPIGPFKLFGSHALLSEVFRTMTGVCGPYNLGGSVTKVRIQKQYVGQRQSISKVVIPRPAHGPQPTLPRSGPTCVANPLKLSSSLRSKRLTKGYYVSLALVFKLI